MSPGMINLPAGYFGIVLGIIGMGFAWRYAAWQSAGLWRGNHPQTATTPGLYLPTVANNFISAPVRASLGIQLAPALVACSAYLSVNGGQAELATTALPLFIFTNAIIGLLLVRTFILLIQGKLIVRTAMPMKKDLL